MPERSPKLWRKVALPLFAAAFLLLGLAGGCEALAGDKLEVLILSSFSKDLPAQAALERGLDQELGYRSGRNNVFFEFLDSPRLPLDRSQEGMKELIAKKYKDRHFDAVVAWALPAAKLVAANRHLFGPETPILFLELAETELAAMGLPAEHNFGFAVTADYTASLQEALRLSKAQRIAVIAEASTPLGSYRLERFREALAAVAPQIAVEEMFDLPLDQVIARTSKLPPGTIIYYLLLFSDGRGTQMVPFEVARRINESANVPMFSQWESLMGSGVVGGYQLSMEAVGQNVGKSVASISRGQPLVTQASMRYVYDWRQLEKWGWDKRGQLSPDVLIQNQPPDILSAYRWHILTASLFIVALIVLAVSLARALHARNRAVLELAKERETLALRVEERTAELARSNKELESFAYAISHDLRAPVRTVNSFARLLEKRFREVLSGEGAEFLDYIRNSASQMDTMILGLLDYSRVGHQSPDSFQSADIPAIAREVAQFLRLDASAAGGRIEVEAPKTMPAIRCNRELIKRLMQNLIENALKYRSPERVPAIRIGFARQNREIKVSVHDNGVGIPEDKRERVFQMFQRNTTAEVPGYGIGLALCQRIVEAHGGRIWIESEPGGGCCFCFTLAENRLKTD